MPPRAGCQSETKNKIGQNQKQAEAPGDEMEALICPLKN